MSSTPEQINPSTNVYLNALQWGGWRWTDGAAAGTNITYYFGPSGEDLSKIFGSGFPSSVAWLPDQETTYQTAYQNAVQQWANVANITFTQVFSPDQADIIEFLYDSSGSSLLGIHGTPQDAESGNGTAFGAYNVAGLGFTPSGLQSGGYGFITLVHEIGHGLGLAHPHDGGGGSSLFPGIEILGYLSDGTPYGAKLDLGDNDLNQGVFTIMSYADGWTTLGSPPSVNYGWQTGPMAFDIAAIQYLYGANTTYHSGENNYVLGHVSGLPDVLSCIWDAGGIDSIAYGGTYDCTIDLRAATLTNSIGGGGYVSFVQGATSLDHWNAFTIASGVVIEKAIGGSGNDTITGNAAANELTGNGGNDTLVGGGGNDTIDGGDGTNDTAVFQLDSGFYDIKRYGDKVIVASKFLVMDDRTDTLFGVEFLQFKDKTIPVFNNPDLPDLSAGTQAGGTPSDGGVTAGGSSGTDASSSSTPPLGATIVGNDTSEYLSGTSGPDILIGNGGDDVLTGYGGQDSFDGGLGSDTVDYSYQPADVSGTVDLAAGTANFPGFYTEQLTSIENVWMGAGNDHLYGDAGANDLRGGPGNDVLNGGDGNDKVYGDWKYSDQSGIDTAVLSYTFGSDYTVSGSANALHIVGAEGDDWYYNVEHFEFAGNVIRTAAEVLSGSVAADMQTIERVSVASDGAQAQNFGSFHPTISADGRFIAFDSSAPNLVENDTNAISDIFVRDLLTQTTDRVSISVIGSQANGGSTLPTISGDGRYVVFSSNATNLVNATDTNENNDIFVKDLQSGAIVRISQTASGAQANGASYNPGISADGRYVVFASNAPNLVSGDTNGEWDVFRKDLSTGTLIRVSQLEDATSDKSGFITSRTSVSADGRYVAFWSDATSLVAGDTPGTWDIFVKDLTSGTLTRIPAASSTLEVNTGVPMSDDGRHIVFASANSDLVVGDTNGVSDIFVKDMISGAIVCVSNGTSGAAANGPSDRPSISADGRYVVFSSSASNLVADDVNGSTDLFVKDQITGAIERLPTSAAGSESYFSSISTDGRSVAFLSSASNLVPGDTNGQWDIFVVRPGQEPTARDDALATSEDMSVSGNLLSDNGYGADSEPNGDSLTVVAVNGVTANVRQGVPLASGALLIVNPDGRFVYDPNGKFEALNVGQTASDSFTYTISDSQGHTSTATASFTITGADDGVQITGGAGTLNGTATDDQITGGPGNEIIYGGAGYDWLQGGLGEDTLYGEADSDILQGGDGNDTLVGGPGFDWIDGGAGIDRASYIDATNGVRANLGDPSQNSGDAAGDAYTSIEGLVGSNFNDTLIGDSGDNSLSGLGGNDILIGGAGADSLDGESGTDRASYATAIVGLTANLGNPSQNNGDAQGDTYVGIEGLQGTSFNDTLIGNNGNNFLIGGSGLDALNGGAGFDTADYRTAIQGLTVDLATPANNTGDAAGDTFNSIERLRGSTFADFLYGDNNGNTLDGATGGDHLDGRGGFDYARYSSATGSVTANLADPTQNTGDAAADTYVSIEGLWGSDFSDTLIGDANTNYLDGAVGSDLLDGREGYDYARYLSATAGVTASLTNPVVNTGDAIGDTYLSIEGLAGSNFGDVLIGDANLNTLTGYLGGDVLDGRSGFDYAAYWDSSTGLTASLANPASNTGEAAGDTYISIEGLIGTDFGDTLIGNDGSNWLVGGGGIDNLVGQGGLDYAAYWTASVGLNVSLANPAINTGDAAGDTNVSIEGLVGSNFGDMLIGDGGDNYLRGESGADSLIGGDGSDTAVYSGNRASYSIIENADSSITIMDTRSGSPDGVDIVSTTELFQFADGTVTLVNLVNDAPVVATAIPDQSSPEDHAWAFQIPANSFSDVNGDVLTYTAMLGDGSAMPGWLSFDSDTRTFSGTPPADFNGSLDVKVIANDGEFIVSDTFTLNITPVDDVITNGNVGGTVTGTAGNDLIDGQGGSDLINAGNGNDKITGGTGADFVNAGAGDDTIIATIGDGIDVYFGGTGVDTLDMSRMTAPLTINLAGFASSTQTGLDVLNSIENAVGGSGNDTISGNGLANVLDGRAGNDTMNGGQGADILIGGTGNDTMNGGAGSDTFVFAPGFGNDRIQGFDANPAGGQDFLDVTAFGISAADFAMRIAIADVGADTLVTVDGVDTIRLVGIGNAANVTINDFLFV
ncbi:Ig-like domain-containing protein [Bradyrhizobium liaoningense]|uniref:Ig-like domain-containing protein n=1 Tax=Bradyrhizobium liaoningense TaxID=43992 RepID=UPI0004B60B27|nr:putative Ig domain-containing protein [Bradyrhizobium liaoningense]